MQHRKTRLARALSACLLATSPIMGWTQAADPAGVTQSQIQTAVIEFSIPAQAMDAALQQFSAISGIDVGYTAEMTHGLKASAVKGNMLASKALQQLLQGTQIVWRQTGENSLVLEAGEPNSGALMLEPAHVKDSGNDSQFAGEVIDISYEQLKRIQPTDLKDIFTTESAVAVGGSIPMNQKLYLRGVEEAALLVTIDGSRQNNRIFHHSATTLIDPSLLKSVRASSGVSPADDGPGAIGGSIVFETVDVVDLLAKNAPFGGFTTIAYDSNSETLTTAASVYGQQQGFEALAFVNRASGDNYEDGNGDTVNYTEADLFSSLTKVAYQADSGDRFELSYESVNDDASRPYRANFSGLTAGRPTPESREYDLTRNNAVFTYSNQNDSGLWNPKLLIANSETELVTTEISLADPATSFVYTGITESQSLVAENLFVSNFAKITAGVDYYEDSATFLYEGDPNIVEEVENMGVFAQFRHELNQLRLSYGVRYDQQDFTGADNGALDDSGMSANISAQYEVSNYLTLKAAYASVWGGIALAENFILNPGWDYSEGIKSVESDNFVVGVESTIAKLRFGANVYETDINNGRTPSYRAGPGVVSDFDISGHDIFLSYETAYSALSLKYSNIKGETNGEAITSYGGNYFTTPLGELITLSGTTSFEKLPLSLGLDAEISLDNDAVEDSGAKQEGYTVVNLFANYQALEGFNIRLAVNNITDEDYTDRASYGQEFITVKPLLEPGRAVTVSARYQF